MEQNVEKMLRKRELVCHKLSAEVFRDMPGVLVATRRFIGARVVRILPR